MIDTETICITSCIPITFVGDQICVATQLSNGNVYFIFEHRFHMRVRNILQALSKILHEVYFLLNRFSHLNDLSTLEMLMRSFEKHEICYCMRKFASMKRSGIGQGDPKH